MQNTTQLKKTQPVNVLGIAAVLAVAIFVITFLVTFNGYSAVGWALLTLWAGFMVDSIR
ncbi:hypothetical protein [Sinimarinibacterium sp. NLF-5-8]|uniref:hypothetical protein n=1 Tax=Sinimarinibacterium sp. NLF-5-8 TaxID=2698684 RepID=UPI00137C22A9|nr:hypothetical protein [Sinimarinibacterium sp. NLF-5-8]QHS10760.1 hypothetical protein GT972_11820 [Sinimarinibacterium sp. NLF-5-8]